jgi:hypothetical protein
MEQDPSALARELARYVDDTHTGRLVPVDCFSPWRTPTVGKNRAVRLYEELRARRLPYSHEPWNRVPYGPGEEARYGSRGSFQRVRGPDQTLQGGATCLDLSLLYAGMAISADMRPFIALRSTGERHALVVLPLKKALSILSENDAEPPGFIERAAEPGVWDLDVTTAGGLTFGGSDNWLAVDVKQASRVPISSWGSLPAIGVPAVEAMSRELGFAGDRWTLIDVVRVRRTPLEPYQPPIGPSVPAIYGYLPALRSFTDYPTRRALLQELQKEVGPTEPSATIVLHGTQGRGKSMLAHRLAVGADHGCGWFLNATDDKILTRSLAQAERQELNNRGDTAPGAGVDAIDDRALASAALRRLGGSDEPWVVVLDNCDSRPGHPGLRELIPRPRTNGQFVIITTTHPEWREEAAKSEWSSYELPPLGNEDFVDLGLPHGTNGAVYDTPLVAQALVALREQGGVVLPTNTGTDGPALVWHLLRMSEHRQPVTAEVARLLAWCPADPVDPEVLGKIAGRDQGIVAGERLAELSFVSPSRGDGRLAVQMHRLFAAAVQAQTWRDNPTMATDVISRLLGTKAGRQILISAADSKALTRLEGEETGTLGDVPRAVDLMTDRARAGLLWYGLGHIRERRGPVAASGPPFERTLLYLTPEAYPYEVAESLIGRARVVFQNDSSSPDQLAEARERVTEARGLLAELDDPDARQLREQGNALFWLNARKLAGRERNPRKREAKLTEVTMQLWLSYEERLRLARGSDSSAIDQRVQPEPADGLGAERAYYNLAGTYVDLAKVHFDLADGEVFASQRYRELLMQASADLAAARTVYQHVRRLREIRYLGQPHPHLAACIQGEAIVAYYRAVLLGEHGELMDSFELAAEAMRQRQVVAVGLVGQGSAAVLRNGDMRKSEKFLLKVTIAMLFASTPRPVQGTEDVLSEAREALTEILGRVSWPVQIELTGASDGGN